MRTLLSIISILLVGAVCIRAGEEDNNVDDGTGGGSFWDTSEGKAFLSLMNKHLGNSFKYLYTSKQYASQYLDRPGLAKYLEKASANEWEEGLNTIKKYLARGGNIAGFRDNVNVDTKGELNPDDNDKLKMNNYVNTFTNVLRDSKSKFRQMNMICGKPDLENKGDAEICHYLKDKLSNEAERMYELKMFKTICNQMKTLGIGLSHFDKSL